MNQFFDLEVRSTNNQKRFWQFWWICCFRSKRWKRVANEIRVLFWYVKKSRCHQHMREQIRETCEIIDLFDVKRMLMNFCNSLLSHWNFSNFDDSLQWTCVCLSNALFIDKKKRSNRWRIYICNRELKWKYSFEATKNKHSIEEWHWDHECRQSFCLFALFQLFFKRKRSKKKITLIR